MTSISEQGRGGRSQKVGHMRGEHCKGPMSLANNQKEDVVHMHDGILLNH